MFIKCQTCQKRVTKKLPGVQCSKCQCIVHANAECAGLSNKQLAAFRVAESLDWTCKSCLRTSPRRGSIIIPEDESEEEEAEISQKSVKLDLNKLMSQLSKEIEKTISKEIGVVNTTLEYMTDKMEEVSESMETFKERITDLEKKNIYLSNRNSHLEARILAMEQRMNTSEQLQLENYIEITGVPDLDEDEGKKIVKRVAEKIKVENPEKSIKGIKKTILPKGQAIYTVELQMGEQKIWLDNARSNKVYLKDVLGCKSTENSEEKQIFIRETLTYNNRKLLSQAKRELRPVYKFVWVRNGLIKARKNEKSKIYNIRCEEDVTKLLD